VLHSPRRRAAAPPLQATVFSILAAARRRHAIVQALERLPELQAAMIKHVSGSARHASQPLPCVVPLPQALHAANQRARAGRQPLHYVIAPAPTSYSFLPASSIPCRQFEAHSDRAGLGLQLLPGVRALLETLQVSSQGLVCDVLRKLVLIVVFATCTLQANCLLE
jgi:hypothetical protein